MSALQTITDDLLVAAIGAAKDRVVLIAPGVWPPVAGAIASAWKTLDPERITVILDVDPEICRIGYGSLEGIQILQKAAAEAGQAIGAERGVRICVVIADEQTFVFSPTPRQLEVPPGSDPESGTPQPKSNGIILSKPPVALEKELGNGAEGIAERTLGMEPLDEAGLKKVTEDLKANPPKSFDLARAVNVYNSKIQFVELKVGGYRVSQFTVTLPKHLVSIARKNKNLSRKIESAVKLLDGDNPLVNASGEGRAEVYGPKNVSQATIESVRDSIEEKYLRPIRGIGKVILRSQIAEFKSEVERLESILVAFSGVLNNALSEQYRNTANQIADAILPDVLTEIPERWQKQLGPSPDPDHVRFRVVDDLLRSFGDPDKRCQTVKASLVFKDVTYDMLKDEEFIKAVGEHFPELPLVEEYSAAKERTPQPQTELSF